LSAYTLSFNRPSFIDFAMSLKRTTNGLFLLVALAACGVVMIAIPSWIASQLETVSSIGPAWLVYVYVAVVGTGAIVLLGCTGTIVWKLWQRTRNKRVRREKRNRNPSELTRDEREQELAENLASVDGMRSDLPTTDELLREIEPLSRQIEEKRESQQLELVAFGAISSGKSSLLNALAGEEVFQTDLKGGTTAQRNEVPWPGIDKVTLVDTPGLGEVDGAARGSVSASAAKDADLVLLVVDGPLREWEFQLLTQLGDMEKRVLICLNKEDWYDAQEQKSLLGQIRSQVKPYVDGDDIVTVRSQTTKRPRVRVMSDGNEVTEMVDVPIDISPLADRMMKTIRRDGRDLLLANLLLQSRGLIDEARKRVEDAIDRRAWETVDKYTWGAGGAAALNPFPMVDLIAGCAISTKMVVDLGQVYRQDVDLQTVVTLLGQLGKNVISAGAVASLLKAVPGIGTLAGGILQGVVQAIVTRWIGAVFINYFKNEMKQPEGGFAAMARKEWERLTTMDELRKLVSAAKHQLSGGGKDER
jgi:small GTP-binding protein